VHRSSVRQGHLFVIGTDWDSHWQSAHKISNLAL